MGARRRFRECGFVFTLASLTLVRVGRDFDTALRSMNTLITTVDCSDAEEHMQLSLSKQATDCIPIWRLKTFRT